MQNTQSPLLTQTEAAQYLRIGLRTFQRVVAPFVGFKVGGRCFYSKELLDGWLETRKLAPCPGPSSPLSTSVPTQIAPGSSTRPPKVVASSSPSVSRT